VHEDAIGRHAEAAQAATEALALDRTNRDAKQILARVTAINRDRLDRASEALGAAKRLGL